MTFPRLTGILLHPISQPSRGGIGDLGPAAYEFIDFLTAGKQGLWQVLPLNPPANGNSPYSSTSAFAGNPQLISLERLVEHGWLELEAVSAFPPATDHIDYNRVNQEKMPLVYQAASNFLNRAGSEAREHYHRFCHENSWWLDDFVAFDVLRQRHGGDWSQWP